MNISKLARIGLITTAIGAISLSGVYYASEYTNIGENLADLKDLALRWQGVAKSNKAEYDSLKAEHDTLSQNFADILQILGMDSGASIEEVKAKLQNIVDNAEATGGIEGANNMLEAIADGLGIELTLKDENGVWKTDEIIEELNKIDTSLDELEEALGDLENGINKDAEATEYSEDMSLVEKINYLIGQINKANDEQILIKENVENALEEVDTNLDEYTVNKDVVEEEPKEEEGGDMTEGNDDPTVLPTKEQAWSDLETDLQRYNTEQYSFKVSSSTIAKVKDGSYTITKVGNDYKINDGGSGIYVEEVTYNLYQAWVNAQ